MAGRGSVHRRQFADGVCDEHLVRRLFGSKVNVDREAKTTVGRILNMIVANQVACRARDFERIMNGQGCGRIEGRNEARDAL